MLLECENTIRGNIFVKNSDPFPAPCLALYFLGAFNQVRSMHRTLFFECVCVCFKRTIWNKIMGAAKFYKPIWLCTKQTSRSASKGWPPLSGVIGVAVEFVCYSRFSKWGLLRNPMRTIKRFVRFDDGWAVENPCERACTQISHVCHWERQVCSFNLLGEYLINFWAAFEWCLFMRRQFRTSAIRGMCLNRNHANF